MLGFWRGQRTKSSKPGTKSQTPPPDPAGHLGPEGTAMTPVGQLTATLQSWARAASGLWFTATQIRLNQTNSVEKSCRGPGGGAHGLQGERRGHKARAPSEHPRACTREQGPRQGSRSRHCQPHPAPDARQALGSRGLQATRAPLEGRWLRGHRWPGESPFVRSTVPAGKSRFSPDGILSPGPTLSSSNSEQKRHP